MVVAASVVEGEDAILSVFALVDLMLACWCFDSNCHAVVVPATRITKTNARSILLAL